MKKFFSIMLIASSTLILAGCTNTSAPTDANANGELTLFAQCLTSKGLKMYGADWCPHCQNMKTMFGSAFEKINYVNCNPSDDGRTMAVQCNTAGIQGFPTWVYNGQKYEGEKTLQELATITSCSLDTSTTTPEIDMSSATTVTAK